MRRNGVSTGSYKLTTAWVLSSLMICRGGKAAAAQ